MCPSTYSSIYHASYKETIPPERAQTAGRHRFCSSILFLKLSNRWFTFCPVSKPTVCFSWSCVCISFLCLDWFLPLFFLPPKGSKAPPACLGLVYRLVPRAQIPRCAAGVTDDAPTPSSGNVSPSPAGHAAAGPRGAAGAGPASARGPHPAGRRGPPRRGRARDMVGPRPRHLRRPGHENPRRLLQQHHLRERPRGRRLRRGRLALSGGTSRPETETAMSSILRALITPAPGEGR